MVPWPIALLALCYGLLAAVSAALVARITAGTVDQPLIWPVAWLALSVSVMCGLPLFKPWARQVAILGSALMMVITLAVAGLLVLADRPLTGLLATLVASVHVVVIRYLQRPVIKAYFRVSPKSS